MSRPGAVASPAAGVRAIVLYKCIKAAVEGLLAAAVTVLLATGWVDWARDVAATVREHVVHAWSVHLAEFALKSLTGKRLYWVVAALIADSIVSGVEGWALSRGYGWAQWLVVAATSLLLPVELRELAEHSTIGRLVIFAINLAITLYLLKRAMRDHHLAHPHRPHRR
jgi:uncharacterized membrane protein (DUF2068 family)